MFMTARHGLVDYGTMLQAGYFIIPKKLEVAARWSWIRGESGDINGKGTFDFLHKHLKWPRPGEKK